MEGPRPLFITSVINKALERFGERGFDLFANGSIAGNSPDHDTSVQDDERWRQWLGDIVARVAAAPPADDLIPTGRRHLRLASRFPAGPVNYVAS